MTIRPRRSALYMPAANARAIEKARTIDCDVVILDLEDAVAPESKALARRQAIDAVTAGGFGRREVVVRVNGLDTPWGQEDLAALAGTQLDAILVPKVSSASDVAAYRDAIPGATPLWAMIETCAAMFQLGELAAAAEKSRMTAWVIGSNDLSKEMRCKLDAARRPIVPFLAMAVAAARSAGLAILDGVFNDLEDDTGFAGQCEQGVEYGFDGKTLIHPRQAAIANQVFSPSAEELSDSRAIVAAFSEPANADKGAIKVQGRMVERLHLEIAQRVIAVAALIEAG